MPIPEEFKKVVAVAEVVEVAVAVAFMYGFLRVYVCISNDF